MPSENASHGLLCEQPSFSLFTRRLAVFHALILSLAACVSTKSAESRLAATEKMDTGLVQRVETGPEDSVILKFGPVGTAPDEGRGALGTAYPPSAAVLRQHLPDSNRATVENAGLLPPHGPLVEAQFIHHGPSSVTTATETHAEAKVDAKAASTAHSAPSAGCMLGLGFWGAIAIAVLLGAAILYLRVRP